MSELRTEISRRRTFAIISHPDAGKTTLTEKFLLYGGAIAQAGEVKGKRARAATSDWMEIEKQRGISVTSSVLQFQHSGFCINILDTPGHQDFSEDTYRTLMAADSAVMVIDGAKGVEPQTRKLFRVCAIRHIPIFTFINKMDRETKDPLELCEEVERELGIDTYAVNWPIGSGKEFQGVYDREKQRILFFQAEERGKKVGSAEVALDDPALEDMIGAQKAAALREEVELLGAGREFDMEAVRNGTLSPVFFGSALTTFGVEPFLEEFLRMTTPPLPRVSDQGEVDVFSEDFSAFVFKIQANMNKAHRDRLAFMRICSGKFERDTEYFHVQGNKKLRLSQPQQMMAAEREIIDEAYAGDIIGVFDPGIFSIGDTVTVPGKKFKFSGIPTFEPEHFMRVSPKDTMKRKQFIKGTEQIAQEGAIQIFKLPGAGLEEVIVGVVGTLQFDVFQYRMRSEYGVELYMEGLPYEHLRVITACPCKPEDLVLCTGAALLEDFKGRLLVAFGGEWSVGFLTKHNPGLELGGSGAADEINDQVQAYTDQLIAQFQTDCEAAGESYQGLDVTSSVVTDSDTWFTLRIDATRTEASGYNFTRFYHINKATGEAVTLSDLFRPDADYVSVLSAEVLRQMEEQMAADASLSYLTDEFTAIDPEQSFYWNADGDLVLVFDEYAVAAGYMGMVEFTIPQDVYSALLK